MKPYSLDLRKRAITLYQENPCLRAVARQLKTSHVWVRDIVALWRETGSLDTRPKKHGRPPTLADHEKQQLRQWLAEDNGLTLKELQQRLADHGVNVSHTTVDNALKAMRITRKKNDRRRRKESPRRPGKA